MACSTFFVGGNGNHLTRISVALSGKNDTPLTGDLLELAECVINECEKYGAATVSYERPFTNSKQVFYYLSKEDLSGIEAIKQKVAAVWSPRDWYFFELFPTICYDAWDIDDFAYPGIIEVHDLRKSYKQIKEYLNRGPMVTIELRELFCVKTNTLYTVQRRPHRLVIHPEMSFERFRQLIDDMVHVAESFILEP